MKIITVKLSDKAEKYFNEVLYSLDKGDGTETTESDVINEILESNSDFEKHEGQSVSGYIQDNYNHYADEK